MQVRVVALVVQPPLDSAVDRDAFDADLAATLKGRHTVQEFKTANAVSRLRSLAESGVDPGTAGRATS